MLNYYYVYDRKSKVETNIISETEPTMSYWAGGGYLSELMEDKNPRGEWRKHDATKKEIEADRLNKLSAFYVPKIDLQAMACNKLTHTGKDSKDADESLSTLIDDYISMRKNGVSMLGDMAVVTHCPVCGEKLIKGICPACGWQSC